MLAPLLLPCCLDRPRPHALGPCPRETECCHPQRPPTDRIMGSSSTPREGKDQFHTNPASCSWRKTLIKTTFMPDPGLIPFGKHSRGRQNEDKSISHTAVAGRVRKPLWAESVPDDTRLHADHIVFDYMFGCYRETDRRPADGQKRKREAHWK